jgi:hypothetical protein
VPPVFENGALGPPTVARVRFSFPVFCTVKVSVEDPPVPTVPKSTGLGLALISAASDVPLRAIEIFGLSRSFEGIMKLLGKLPSMVGVN